MLGGTLGAIGPVGAAAGAVGAGLGVGAGGFYGGWESLAVDPDPIVSQSINRGTQNQRGFMDALAWGMFPLNLMQGVLALGDTSIGQIAQGDPSGTGPAGGPGGVVSPGSTTLRAITQALAPPPAPVAPPPVAPPLADDRKRKRVGRQETILTSRSALSDAPTFRPTLLGQ